MMLMTPKLQARFAEVGGQRNVGDPIVIAKFFNPTGSAVWYATEYSAKDEVFYGVESIWGLRDVEWGYFSLADLSKFRGDFGLGIERDSRCGEFPISNILPKTGSGGC